MPKRRPPKPTKDSETKKPQRPSEDNVIYANFGQRKRVSTAEETLSIPRDAAGSAPNASGDTLEALHSNAPARRLLDAMMRKAETGRLSRGRAYAAKGNVLSVAVEPGKFVGSVAGTQNEPFTPVVILPYRTTEQVQEAVQLMASSRGEVRAARAGRFSEPLLKLLLASDREPVRFMCDCPDNTDVCKHAIAVTFKAAEMLDADPTVLFRLRKLDPLTVERQLLESSKKRANVNHNGSTELFWEGRELPDLPTPKVAPMIEDSDIDLLHRAMQSISFTNLDQLRGVADIEDLYQELTRRD
ncbi:hypothetical protein [Corynebacterium aquatimens]|uniref:Zn finger protein n=1 Tax=Corynebacterium aquatimens TaxID=1190508 RepID=A0A931GVK1_9CORY|nr:hypothetical protein [Corynebacterium aquatimens]MBG6121336.1 putative Zn finger protein [Corynebacterium aquatimens]WJY66117.1 hypothetical protein CAQUA_07095 [Corynebacterium aquatimens]